MTHTCTEQAQIAAERIRSAIHNTSIDVNGTHISTTISVGIASFPESVNDAADVLDKADIALYKSKHGGRDRGTYYDRGLEALPVCA